MFNPWALLFHIVCLLFCVFFIEFPSWSLKSFQYLLLSFLVVVLKSQISEYEFCTFLVLVRVVFLGRALFLRPPRFQFFVPVVSRALFFRGINGSERSWVFFFVFAQAILKVNTFFLFVTLRNLFSRILHTIFSEPIYGLSFFLVLFILLARRRRRVTLACASCTKMYLLKD